MSCSSKTKLTRYSKEELHGLKYNKLSQEVPKCLLEPKILILDIVDNVSEVTGMMSMLSAYKDRLNSMNNSEGTWNPSCAQFLSDYKRFIANNQVYAHQMNRMNNPYTAPYQAGQNFIPNMPFSDPQHQAALLDKIPPYDRSKFFDTITTTTAMRPPPRMGINSLNAPNNGYQNRNFNNNNGYMRKPNPYHRDTNYGMSAKNSFSQDSNKSSSFEGSINENSKDFGNKAESLEKLNNDGNNEPEPEWFTNPASVDDVIDLHGFEEGDIENQPEPKVNTSVEKGYGTPSLAYRRSGYNQNRYARGNFHNVRNNVNTNYNNNNNNNGGFNNQRFRNPLNYNNNNSFNLNQMPITPAWTNPINPFFEMWQKAGMVPGQGCSLSTLMNRASLNSQIQQNGLNDVESTLRASNYLTSLINRAQMTPQQVNQQHISMPVSQFFNNWPQQQQAQPMSSNGIKMPTQEQLQQHTTEIMRNAILRKNQQQYQYNPDVPFQK